MLFCKEASKQNSRKSVKFLPSLFDLSLSFFSFWLYSIKCHVLHNNHSVAPSVSSADLQPDTHTPQRATRDKEPPCKKVRVLLAHRVNEQRLPERRAARVNRQRGDRASRFSSVFHLHGQSADRVRQSWANQRGGACSHLLSGVMDIRECSGGQTGHLTNEFPISSCYYSSIDGLKEKIGFFLCWLFFKQNRWAADDDGCVSHACLLCSR